MKKTPILSLSPGTGITAMFADNSSNTVFISLSDGRILRINEIRMLAALTGKRMIEAQVTDGYGNISATGSADVFYALHNRVIEINSEKEQIRWKEATSPFSATSEEEVTGMFTSPVLWGGLDLGFWKGLYWEKQCPSDTYVDIYARVAGTPELLVYSPWVSMTPGSHEVENTGSSSSTSSSSVVSETTEETVKLFKSMDGFNFKGNYLQLRAYLRTRVPDATPKVLKMTASYETKFAVYFFTQKFIMQQGSNIDSLFITGTYSMPQNTEIRFGVAGTGSAEWSDYTVVEPGVLTMSPAGVSDRFKIGVKLTSYDDTNFPVLDEFAVTVGAEKDNLINRPI